METGEIISYINNKLTVLEKYERKNEGLVYLGLHENLVAHLDFLVLGRESQKNKCETKCVG
jgi:hypothetical protein